VRPGPHHCLYCGRVLSLERLAFTLSWEGGVETSSMSWEGEAGREPLEEGIRWAGGAC
jgi:hypothetical protein